MAKREKAVRAPVRKTKASTRPKRAAPDVDLTAENARLKRELADALEQQNATADVLHVISRSPGDLQPVFKSMLNNALRICEAKFGQLLLFDGTGFLPAELHNSPVAYGELFKNGPLIPGARTALGRVIASKQVAQVADVMAGSTYAEGDPLRIATVDILQARTLLAVPMLKDTELVGAIVIYRQEVRPFSDRQIELVASFASQAVIAIENTQLLKELRQRTDDLSESLQQQTATADVLKVISRSTFDLQIVLDTLIQSAAKLCEADKGAIFKRDGDLYRWSANFGNPPELEAFARAHPFQAGHQSVTSRVALEGKAIHIADVLSDPEYGASQHQKLGAFRTILGVPLLREGMPIGVFVLTRDHVKAFTDKQIELVQTFADQAVIAIENVRLFDEVQARTRELQESLEYQTATADVLNVISRSTTNAQPVFDAIAKSAARLFAPCETTLTTVHDGQFHWGATASLGRPVEAIERVRAIYPIPFDIERSPSARAVHERRIIEIPDVLAPDTPETTRRAQSAGGFRSITFVPLLRDGVGIGTIILTHPEAGFKLSPKQLALVQTFADQAVIAIENARLFDEVQARTRELMESLEQQTATSEVLSVISSSAGDLVPVFDAMLGKAMQLCGADFGVLNTFDGELFHTRATRGLPSAYDKYRRSQPLEYGPGTAPHRLLNCEPIVEISDLRESDAYRKGEPNRRALVDLGGASSLLAVPLLKDEQVVGNVMIFRQEKRQFSDKQIALLKQFAAQAVIAIENTRLLRELRSSTEELSESLQFQTATSEVLKVISRSPDALQPVLDVIVKISQELCGSDASTIFLLRDGKFHVTAVAGIMPVHLDTLRANPAPVDQPGSILARIAREKRTLHYANVADDPELKAGITGRGGPRTLLTVPLMRDGEVMGAITMRRAPNLPFSGRQIEAIEAFADQAVIAISNVGLFEQVQERTRELSNSLDDLRTAQDRLVQTEKLASLGQLTAGIAHEIKNPLNFVNNFSALSTELIDELNDVLRPVGLDDKARGEVDELTQMLKGNLQKVVQHGKRADSIVKNMLLHSREGAGEHRPVDINAIVEESLNLAYHGARAERPNFNITLRRDLDPEAGMIDLYPQEITRVLLNLISNGFYAATKRKEGSGQDFEPTLSAVTKNLGDTVEIRIRDNGTGIPLDVKEKMFNPFFTTKPAGEGTGLGLSMSHDIVVKQHGGKIDVDTEPGAFTEFIITLPRNAAAQIQSGGTN